MIQLSGVGDLTLVGVFDRGRPNLERIIIEVNVPTQVGEYLLLVGYRAQGHQGAMPLYDQCFWFGEWSASAPSTIFVYTGPGTARATTVAGSDRPAYVLHWARNETIFADQMFVPILTHFDAVSIEPSPINQPQLALRPPQE